MLQFLTLLVLLLKSYHATATITEEPNETTVATTASTTSNATTPSNFLDEDETLDFLSVSDMPNFLRASLFISEQNKRSCVPLSESMCYFDETCERTSQLRLLIGSYYQEWIANVKDSETGAIPDLCSSMAHLRKIHNGHGTYFLQVQLADTVGVSVFQHVDRRIYTLHRSPHVHCVPACLFTIQEAAGHDGNLANFTYYSGILKLKRMTKREARDWNTMNEQRGPGSAASRVVDTEFEMALALSAGFEGSTAQNQEESPGIWKQYSSMILATIGTCFVLFIFIALVTGLVISRRLTITRPNEVTCRVKRPADFNDKLPGTTKDKAEENSLLGSAAIPTAISSAECSEQRTQEDTASSDRN